jgi:flagellar biosynthetic protein FlhB
MADSPAGDKTEKPSFQKLRKTREKGEIARSKDVSLAGSLLAAFMVISHCMPLYRDFIRESFTALHQYGGSLMEPQAIGLFLQHNVLIFIKFILTLTPIPLAAAVTSLIPGGWIFTTRKLMPDLGKLSPLRGLGNLFSAQHTVDVGKMALKCIVMLGLLYQLIISYAPEFLHLQSLFFDQAVDQGLFLFRDILFNFILLIGFFALIDIPLTRYLFTKKLRMTKHELKEEYKSSEGKPEVKARIRQLQRQFAMGQIRRSVPQADVILTNPTHYAVALKYDHTRAAAPFIVAKGTHDIALFIRQVAKEENIDIVEFPALTRALYHTTQINQQIPTQLYRAIAHVLTYVLQLKAYRAGGVEKPQLNRYITIPKEVLKPDADDL